MSDDGTGTGTGTGSSNTQNDDGGTGGGDGAAGAGEASSSGYPANTPVADMKPAEQAAYWKAQSRKHEGRLKNMGSPDEIKSLRENSAELAKLRKERMTDTDRAVAEAREGALADANKAWATRLVEAEFRAATAGRIDAADLAELLDPMDLTRFIAADGGVDREKVTQLAARLAGTAGGAGQTNGAGAGAFPFIGQGRRTATQTDGLAAGRAAFEARKGQNGMPSF